MKLALAALRKVLEAFGVAVTRPATLRGLVLDRRELERTKGFFEFLRALTPDAAAKAAELFPASRGENFQDIFAMLVLGTENEGFFVEFGATDGVTGSNSYLMEKSFGWRGVLAEPAQGWLDALKQNRTAVISNKCVWRESGQRLAFRETSDGGLSTLEAFSQRDRHAARRQAGRTYDVETISLNDLLENCDAPTVIDLLSVDTEGSEFEILSALDFEKWKVSVLIVEHNFRPEREQINALMTGRGYMRGPTSVSKYDDWYVASHLSSRLKSMFRQEAWERDAQRAGMDASDERSGMTKDQD